MEESLINEQSARLEVLARLHELQRVIDQVSDPELLAKLNERKKALESILPNPSA